MSGNNILTAELESVVASNAALVDDIVAKFREKLTGLVEKGVVTSGAVLTHMHCRMEYSGGKSTEWVTDDGQIFVTKTDQTGFDRPHAPVIPSSVKKLNKAFEPKDVDKAKADLRKVRLGFFALSETTLATPRAPRTLPGITGKQYSSNHEIREMQKYADAGEKIGL